MSWSRRQLNAMFGLLSPRPVSQSHLFSCIRAGTELGNTGSAAGEVSALPDPNSVSCSKPDVMGQ